MNKLEKCLKGDTKQKLGVNLAEFSERQLNYHQGIRHWIDPLYKMEDKTHTKKAVISAKTHIGSLLAAEMVTSANISSKKAPTSSAKTSTNIEVLGENIK